MIKENIQSIEAEINNIKKQCNITVPITIMAVTKNVTVNKIEEAIEAGIVNFGENYIQEAEKKWGFLKEKYKNKIKLHFIGKLQTNKVNKALELFDVIQTLDSKKLINKIVNSGKNLQNKEFFIQVNLSTNLQRAGVNENNLQECIELAKHFKLNVKGLMAIASLDESSISMFFSRINKLNLQYGFKNLSTGMSSDYIEAIKNGSTLIRIGTKIFGKRLNAENICNSK